MSEQKQSSFMQQLDRWTEATVINPLAAAILDAHEEPYQAAVAQIKKAVREKVLESYHNGQQASPRREKGGKHT